MQIPSQGIDRKQIFETLEAYRANDLKWREGRAFGLVFDAGPEVMAVGKEAYNSFLTENGMDFSAFQSLIRIENELVAMTAAHLRGDDKVVGNFTSGGTESIILAVKTARDFFRKKRPDIKAPEMILPTSGHAAFHKAAHYLDVKVVPASVDSSTFRADVESVRQAITPNTIYAGRFSPILRPWRCRSNTRTRATGPGTRPVAPHRCLHGGLHVALLPSPG